MLCSDWLLFAGLPGGQQRLSCHGPARRLSCLWYGCASGCPEPVDKKKESPSCVDLGLPWRVLTVMPAPACRGGPLPRAGPQLLRAFDGAPALGAGEVPPRLHSQVPPAPRAVSVRPCAEPSWNPYRCPLHARQPDPATSAWLRRGGRARGQVGGLPTPSGGCGFGPVSQVVSLPPEQSHQPPGA